MTPHRVGRVAWLQLHNCLGPLGQAGEVPLVLIQLLLLILWERGGSGSTQLAPSAGIPGHGRNRPPPTQHPAWRGF